MLAGLVLAGLVVLAAVAPLTGRTGAAALVLTSLLWLLVNAPVEGRVIFSLTASHGLTSGDLAGLAGLAISGWLFLRGRP